MRAMPHFSASEIKELFPRARERTYAAGQIIIYQGDEPNYVFYVLKGHIKKYDIESNGNESIIQIFEKQSMLPIQTALSTKKTIDYFYTSITDCELLLIDADDIKATRKNSSEFNQRLVDTLFRKNQLLTDRLTCLVKPDARSKIISTLLFLAKYHGLAPKNGWHKVNFAISHQFIADMIGLTRETVSIVLNELEDEKLIKSPGYMTLHVNFDKLAEQE